MRSKPQTHLFLSAHGTLYTSQHYWADVTTMCQPVFWVLSPLWVANSSRKGTSSSLFLWLWYLALGWIPSRPSENDGFYHYGYFSSERSSRKLCNSAPSNRDLSPTAEKHQQVLGAGRPPIVDPSLCRCYQFLGHDDFCLFTWIFQNGLFQCAVMTSNARLLAESPTPTHLPAWGPSSIAFPGSGLPGASLWASILSTQQSRGFIPRAHGREAPRLSRVSYFRVPKSIAWDSRHAMKPS